jgi:tricorn protease
VGGRHGLLPLGPQRPGQSVRVRHEDEPGVRALASDGFDFKSASAGPDAIVIEQFGAIKLYDLASRQAKTVSITVAADVDAVRRTSRSRPEALPELRHLSHRGRAGVRSLGRDLHGAHRQGRHRNLTRSPAVADRDPSWSPDGKSLAYFTDQSGEYELAIRDQNGLGETRRISLGTPPSFFYSPTWSPDSRRSRTRTSD